MNHTEQCTHRTGTVTPDGQLVYGPRCGMAATDVNYGDQGRYVYPVCSRHYDPPGRFDKGPEDY